MRPGNLVHSRSNAAILEGLLQHADVKRMAAFGSAQFSRSVFACTTFNFGPRTCTLDHRDCGNLPFGWCAISALGDFDPQQGGHLVLWDLKLVIEFPPGLQPSAAYYSSLDAIEREEVSQRSVARWMEGMALFSTLDELRVEGVGM
ncbi:uncharacterized protein B0H18DRAFT_1086333 [Fomitopsis serialis]|uniref:uncharacterized protein n=1 Tax=Fomitopsis serialis TaxID=139415 RepID=UPI00200842F3|nr:uncharacterized protein B0H18DRAFT_1086333 [Neoantrodia serialis]KAH9920702.1 hypothetical protein B0H18DRAFT_1086333 [Neoantrodia serialis]